MNDLSSNYTFIDTSNYDSVNNLITFHDDIVTQTSNDFYPVPVTSDAERLTVNNESIKFGDDQITILPQNNGFKLTVGDVFNLAINGDPSVHKTITFGSDTFHLQEGVGRHVVYGDFSVMTDQNPNTADVTSFNLGIAAFAQANNITFIGGTDTFITENKQTDISAGIGNNIFKYYINVNDDETLSLSNSTFTKNTAIGVKDNIINFNDGVNYAPDPVSDKIIFLVKDEAAAAKVQSALDNALTPGGHITLAGSSDNTVLSLDGGQRIELFNKSITNLLDLHYTVAVG